MARFWNHEDQLKADSSFGAYAPDPASNDAANYGYGRQGADGAATATFPEPGSNDAANYGYGRQGADGYAGGYAPQPGSNDAANYGYGREGTSDTYAGAYAPASGSNDAANYGYGREGLRKDAHVNAEVRIVDDFALWDGADPALQADTDLPEPSDSSADEKVRQCLKDDWMVDADNIDVSVSGEEAVLSGTVVTRAQKQRAEDLVLEMSGISAVQNNIRIDNLGANG